MRQTTLAVLTASLLLAALSGCGGDPKPTHSKSDPPSPSITVVSSPTPSVPVPPQMPTAAHKHTVTGAKAFSRYVISASNYGQAAADPHPLQEISSQHCDGCQSAVRFIQGLARKDAHVDGGLWASDRLSVRRLAAGPHGLMQVTINGHTSRQVITYPGGHHDVYPATPRITVRFLLIEVDQGWAIDKWEVR